MCLFQWYVFVYFFHLYGRENNKHIEKITGTLNEDSKNATWKSKCQNNIRWDNRNLRNRNIKTAMYVYVERIPYWENSADKTAENTTCQNFCPSKIFIRRNILSAVIHLYQINNNLMLKPKYSGNVYGKIRNPWIFSSDKTAEVTNWCRKFCPPKFSLGRRFAFNLLRTLLISSISSI